MMGGIEYVYIETHSWSESVKFWSELGYEVELDLGDSGKLLHADGSRLFIEEVPPDTSPSMQLYLKGEKGKVPASAKVAKDWSTSHWGSHLLELEDPDGRIVVCQDRD